MRIDSESISKSSPDFSNDFVAQAPAGSEGLTYVPPDDGVDDGGAGGPDQLFESKKKPSNAGASTTLTCGEGTTLTVSTQGNTGTMTCAPNDKPAGSKPNPGSAPILP
jgi:hypothetical protein